MHKELDQRFKTLHTRVFWVLETWPVEFLQKIFISHHSTPIQFLSQKTIFIKIQA